MHSIETSAPAIKLTACGGTDIASMILFWPEHVPDLADATIAQDPVTLAERLERAGKLVRFPCEADGHYSLAVYVNSPVPDELLKLASAEDRIPQVEAKGDAYFGGVEYLFKHNPDFSPRDTNSCKRVPIPEGVYTATIYRIEAPESLHDQWIGSHTSPTDLKVKRLDDHLAAAALAATIAAAVSIFAGPRALWITLAVIAAILGLAALALSRCQGCRACAKAEEDFEHEYPSYVLQLE